MTRADLIALAARVEQAQGPDRELDAAIATMLGWTEVHGSVLRPDFRGGRPPGVIDWWDIVPIYTASLDAALTLVPEGYVWTLHGEPGGAGLAGVQPDRGDGDGCDYSDVNAATPVLALTAAALRARAEDGNDG